MMREQDIERICHDLERLWKQHPEQRLGQLLENYVFPSTLTKQGGRTALTFFQEDEETGKRIILNTGFQHPSPFESVVVSDKSRGNTQ